MNKVQIDQSNPTYEGGSDMNSIEAQNFPKQANQKKQLIQSLKENKNKTMKKRNYVQNDTSFQ